MYRIVHSRKAHQRIRRSLQLAALDKLLPGNCGDAGIVGTPYIILDRRKAGAYAPCHTAGQSPAGDVSFVWCARHLAALRLAGFPYPPPYLLAETARLCDNRVTNRAGWKD